MKEIPKIDGIKIQVNKLSFNKDDFDRYWEKLSLEWNYNSNHLEGNTLTYGDTMLLLLKDQVPQGGSHTMRELDEMRAHDVAIELIRQWSKTDRFISETEIRQLNKTILVKPFWKAAETSTGEKTRKKIIPGQYKETPNHVRLSNGKIFKYSEPESVPGDMRILLDWYRTENNLHPVEKAALFHYKFVLIHPFDDGNGRISRLLMNYHLLRSDYAPIIIKSSDKKNYLFALRQADTGDIDTFVEYIMNQAINSMELLLKAKKGESIEESDDWKKELNLLKKQQNIQVIKRSEAVIARVIVKSIYPLYKHLSQELSAHFNDLFTSSKKKFLWGSTDVSSLIENEKLLTDHIFLHRHLKSGAKLSFSWKGYKKSKLQKFEIDIDIQCGFHEAYYSYSFKDFRSTKKTYDEFLSKEEINALGNMVGQALFKQIKEKSS